MHECSIQILVYAEKTHIQKQFLGSMIITKYTRNSSNCLQLSIMVFLTVYYHGTGRNSCFASTNQRTGSVRRMGSFSWDMFGCFLQIGISLVSIHSSSEILFYLLVIFVCRHLAVVSFHAPLPLSCRHHFWISRQGMRSLYSTKWFWV